MSRPSQARPTLPVVRVVALHRLLYLFEALELAIFMAAACGFSVLLFRPPVTTAIPDPWLRQLVFALVMGAVATGVILSPMGRRSGAHFNPACTLTYFRLGKIMPVDAMCYVVCALPRGRLRRRVDRVLDLPQRARGGHAGRRRDLRPREGPVRGVVRQARPGQRPPLSVPGGSRLYHYALPTAVGTPVVEWHDNGLPFRGNVHGAKACAESGTAAAPPTVMNAVGDALRPAGTACAPQMPATPFAVWTALQPS